MKRTVCFLLIVMIVLSCGQKRSVDKRPDIKEFEGVVTYHVEYSNYPRSFKCGDTVKIFYSHGNLLKISNGTNPEVPHREVLLLAGNKYYLDKGDPDTLYWVDISDNSMIDLEKETHTFPETRILGHSCEQVMQEMTGHKDRSMHFRQEYLFAKDVLQVNKDYFKERKLSCYNRFIDQSGALHLKFTFVIELPDDPLPHSFSYTAVNIKEEKIDPALFHVDTAGVRAYKFD